MRYVSTDKLVTAVRRKFLGAHRSRFTAADEDVVEEAIRAYMKRQPRTPKLVSRQTAAEMLGVQSAHLGRLDGRLPEKVDIEGGRYAYEKDRIEKLARELAAERKHKTSRKETP